MEKTVYGVFESNPEVLQAINALKAKGYEGDDITVIADKEETLEFADYHQTADVNTVTNTTADSFMDKVMRFFSNEGTYGLQDRLGAYGFSDREASEYVNDVEEGKILVLLDSDKDQTVREAMLADDHAPGMLNSERTNQNGLHTKPMNNNPDPNLFPEGTAAIQETTGNLTTNNDRMDGGYATSQPTGDNKDYPATDLTDNNIYSNTGRTENDLHDEEKKLRLREEQLQVNTQEVQLGEVVINKEVTEEQQTVNVPVQHEEVYVERRAVNEDKLDAKDAGPIEDGETIRIPVVEEQVEVTKRPVITEEVVIGKRTVEETQRVQDTVKKEGVQLDRDGNPLVHDEQLKNRIDTDNL